MRLKAILRIQGVLVLSALVWVLAKLALRDVPAFTFVWVQIAIGGTLLTLYTFVLRGERIPKGLPASVWAHMVGIGQVCLVHILRARG